MKKIAILVAIFAIALTANMAFAYDRGNDCDRCGNDRDKDKCECPKVEVNNINGTNVTTGVLGISNSGLNWAKGGSINTGDATNVSFVKTYAGKSEVIINPSAKASVKLNNANFTNANTFVIGAANTGLNKSEAVVYQTRSRCHQSAPTVVGGDIDTGAAYNGSDVMTYAGSSVVKIGCATCMDAE